MGFSKKRGWASKHLQVVQVDRSAQVYMCGTSMGMLHKANASTHLPENGAVIHGRDEPLKGGTGESHGYPRSQTQCLQQCPSTRIHGIAYL